MAKKINNTLGSLLTFTSKLFQETKGDVPYIPSITEFCYSPAYLDLESKGIKLYPVQELVLRAFYRGSAGNDKPEDMKMTEDEIRLCVDKGLNDDHNGNILDKWNSGIIFKELVLVWGRRCISENSKIVEPETGKVWTFGELHKSGRSSISSWTFDQKTGSMKVIQDCQIISQGKREVYKLTTKSGHEIEATENHPFLTQRGWVELKDLIPDKDKVALATSEPFFGRSNAISEDEAALLGYINGDGCCSQDSIHFTCSDNNILVDFREKLERACPDAELFKDDWTGAKSKEYQYKVRFKNRDSFEYEEYFNEKVGLKRVKRKSHSLKNLLVKHDLMGKTCHYKEVPEALYKCPKKVIAAYLNALYSCDGNIHIAGKNQVRIEFTSANKNQSIAIQSLLRRFGIQSSLREKRVKSKIIGENSTVYNYDRIYYNLYFSKANDVSNFIGNIGIISSKKNLILAKEMLKRIESRKKEPVNFNLVKTIISNGEKETFDLQVSNEKSLQNFTTQGFISHNSGKDFEISIIALYEAMRLLECPGGDPHRIYGLGNAAPFNILTIANNKDQAGILFREIHGKMLNSPYFQDKYKPEGITAGKIHLLTPQNKKDNEIFASKGLAEQPGSVVIETGHSNSNGLVGKGCFVLMLDEAGLYKRTGGPGSDEQLYGNLSPTTLTYNRKVPVFDENGKKIDEKTVYDGKIISISSPRGMDGVFYKKYKDAHEDPKLLMCRLPTWDVNTRHSEEDIRAEEQSMTDAKFMMEFGAEFSGTEGENFFPPDFVKKCFFNHSFVNIPKEGEHWGKPGITYFAHLDPAISSHNYALAVVHKHYFVNQKDKKIDFYIVLDHLRVWSPTNGKPININEVDEYVIDLRKRFHLGIVTYDQWNSQSSIEKMRKNGIPSTCTRFNKYYKIQIYDELYKLVSEEKLKLPYYKLMYDEMLNLQRKFMASGYRIYPKTEGECKTDDTMDALAGACFNALKDDAQHLPQSKLVNMGTSPSSNSITWRSMQGIPYGVGSGQQVSNWVSNRTPLNRR